MPGWSADAARRADRCCPPSRRMSRRRRTSRSAGCRRHPAPGLSGTPVHWPIAVQPSSHVWRVICVRDGSRFSSSSENVRGVATRPSTDNRQSANAPLCESPVCVAERRFLVSPGLVVPVAGNDVMSLETYSCTSDCPGQQRAMRRVRQVSPMRKQVAVSRRQILRIARKTSPPTDADPAMIAARRVMSPVVFISFPYGHCPDLTSESGLDDHHDVHDHEQQRATTNVKK